MENRVVSRWVGGRGAGFILGAALALFGPHVVAQHRVFDLVTGTSRPLNAEPAGTAAAESGRRIEVDPPRIQPPAPIVVTRQENTGTGIPGGDEGDPDQVDDSAAPIPRVEIRASHGVTSEPIPTAWILPGQFTVQRSGSLESDLAVHLEYSGSARNGEDYAVLPGLIKIPAGTNQVHLLVLARADDIVEGPEILVARLVLSPEGPGTRAYAVDPDHDEGQVEIRDEDQWVNPLERIALLVEALDAEASEPVGDGQPDPGTFIVRRVAGPLQVEVYFAYVLQGTAENGTDYVRVMEEEVLPAGAESIEIRIEPRADHRREGTEVVQLSLRPIPCIQIYPPPPECYRIEGSGSATIVIRDVDPLRIAGTRRMEGGRLSLRIDSCAADDVVVEASSDMVTWTPVDVQPCANDEWEVQEVPEERRQRYYRLQARGGLSGDGN